MPKRFSGLLALLLLILSTELFTSCTHESNSTNKTIFRYNQAEGLNSLDPADANNQPNVWAVNQLFNGLVELDKEMHVQPCLAETWEISPDQKKYTFHLKKNIYFHQDPLFGKNSLRELNANDVVYSFKRIIDTSGLTNKGLWIFNGKVLTNSDGSFSDTCFKAIDKYTFVMYLDIPCPQMLELLSMPFAFIVPKEIVEHYKADFRKHPVGTGPFAFHLWDEGNALIMHKNPNYWRKDERGNSLPYLDAVKISFIPDKSQAFRSFMMGKLDFVSGLEEGSVDEVMTLDGSFRKDFASKYTCMRHPFLSTEYLGIQMDPSMPVYVNNQKDPLLNKDFRKALAYSIDRKKLITYLRNSIGIPGENGFVPHAAPYYNKELVPGYTYHPEKARQHLIKSGLNISKPIQLNVIKEYKPLAEFIANGWKDVLGIDVKIDINDALVHREMAEQGKINLFKGGWLGDYPDPENYLALLYSKNFAPNGPNRFRYKSTSFDSLYIQTGKIPNAVSRQSNYERMDRIFIEDCPVIVLFYDEVIRICQPSIKGLEPNAMNDLKLERVYVSR